MTIQTACQSAAARLIGRRPSAFFASTDQFSVELSELCNEAAIDIVNAHDWQKLTRLHTITGNGTDMGFPLPDDYGRMNLAQHVHSDTWSFDRFLAVGTLDEWLDLQVLMPAIPPGYWIILDDLFQVIPVLGDGSKALFYYVTNNIFTDAGGGLKVQATADTDSFRLDERVLTLSMIWRWKAMKGLDYQEDMRNYEMALSQATARDQGARSIRSGRRVRGNFSVPFPWTLGNGA